MCNNFGCCTFLIYSTLNYGSNYSDIQYWADFGEDEEYRFTGKLDKSRTEKSDITIEQMVGNDDYNA